MQNQATRRRQPSWKEGGWDVGNSVRQTGIQAAKGQAVVTRLTWSLGKRLRPGTVRPGLRATSCSAEQDHGMSNWEDSREDGEEDGGEEGGDHREEGSGEENGGKNVVEKKGVHRTAWRRGVSGKRIS